MNRTAGTSPTLSGPSRNAPVIGPIRFDPVTRDGAIGRIAELIRAGRGGYVVTPNVDHIVLAHQRPELAEAYRGAALSLADGQPVLWMAKLLGRPLPAKVSGSDLIEPLMAEAAYRGWRVFLFGGQRMVSARAARILQQKYPALEIVGRDTSHWNPSTTERHNMAAAAIRASRAHLVIVALGCPKQELWMARHAAELGGAVAIGLGASLDFVAGAVSRAPDWMSRAGLEWLYRLMQEPRRLAYRYLVRDAEIIPIFLRALWRGNRDIIAPETPEVRRAAA